MASVCRQSCRVCWIGLNSNTFNGWAGKVRDSPLKGLRMRGAIDCRLTGGGMEKRFVYVCVCEYLYVCICLCVDRTGREIQ